MRSGGVLRHEYLGSSRSHKNTDNTIRCDAVKTIACYKLISCSHEVRSIRYLRGREDYQDEDHLDEDRVRTLPIESNKEAPESIPFVSRLNIGNRQAANLERRVH